MSAIRTVMILGLVAGAASLGAAAQTVGPPISLRPPQMPAPAPAPVMPVPAAPVPATPSITATPLPPPAAPVRPAAPPAVAPAMVPIPGPAPNSTVAPPPPPAATAEDVVRAFYAAAGAADGARANTYLVAEKRNHGPYEVRAMGDFYGGMVEPLRLLDAKEIMQGLVRVRYHYVHRSGRRCDGTADVTVVPSEGRLLIERIRAFNGC